MSGVCVTMWVSCGMPTQRHRLCCFWGSRVGSCEDRFAFDISFGQHTPSLPSLSAPKFRVSPRRGGGEEGPACEDVVAP